MGMVFQTYAIWPHMTVFENIAFPLREQRVRSAEIRERVMAMLQTLGLEGFHDRPAPLLSGGQQQRVALGRALVADPDVLLLDEPFSNLDARLREDMRLELKELQTRVGVTTLFVTHDQAEAMILSDRVFVMNGGRIAQDGSPRQIYEHPRTRFVMDFLGQVDHVDARVVRTRGRRVRRPARRRRRRARSRWPRIARGGTGNPSSSRSGPPTYASLRPAATGHWPGTILSTMYLGERIEYVVKLGTAQVRASGAVTDPFPAGAAVHLEIPAGAIRAWPARS